MRLPVVQLAAGALSCAAVLAQGAARAEVIQLHSELRGSSAVPPTDSKATGEVSATLDTDTRRFTYTITYSGLAGPVTAAHFHGPATPGKNGGPALPVGAPSLASPIEGEATLSAAKAADLAKGLWYLNLHDAAYPTGEIRGQIERK